MKDSIVIGSRGSKLALIQSNHIADLLRPLAPGSEFSIKIISTKGDKILDVPLAKIGGKGLFTKELEVAMLDGEIDMAVHSLKDLPTEFPEGLVLGCVPERATPNDALVSAEYSDLAALPKGATVGTSSLRRKAQLYAQRPDLQIIDLRGNIDTRVGRVEGGGLDAAILACAGLERIGRSDAIRQYLPPSIMLPAPGQGALGIEIRKDDPEISDLLSKIHNKNVTAEVSAERTVLSTLGGGCQVPIGALAGVLEGKLSLSACVCSLDGTTILRSEIEGPIDEAEKLGLQVAKELLDQGAQKLIDEAIESAASEE